jgi:hypothetical protein
LFARGIGCDSDGSLERRVRDEVGKWEIGSVAHGKHYNPALICASYIASAAYSHTPLEVQVHIAKYILLAALTVWQSTLS